MPSYITPRGEVFTSFSPIKDISQDSHILTKPIFKAGEQAPSKLVSMCWIPKRIRSFEMLNYCGKEARCFQVRNNRSFTFTLLLVCPTVYSNLNCISRSKVRNILVYLIAVNLYDYSSSTRDFGVSRLWYLSSCLQNENISVYLKLR